MAAWACWLHGPRNLGRRIGHPRRGQRSGGRDAPGRRQRALQRAGVRGWRCFLACSHSAVGTTASASQGQAEEERKAQIMGASTSQLLPSKITCSGESGRIKFGVSSFKGKNDRMEDTFAAVPDLDGSKDSSFFGVYDGHGGHQVALYCSRKFHNELQELHDYENNPVQAVERMFYRMDELLEQSTEWRDEMNPDSCIPCLKNGIWPFNEWPLNKEEYASEGCTACTVLIKGNQIIIRNVGDCQCILSENGQTICLTTEHKPCDPDESKRIREAGGHLIKEFWLVYGRLRNPNHREGGLVSLNSLDLVSLPFSRSIGDSLFKQNKSLPYEDQMVTCTPHISTVDITPDTEFLVLGSYGLWKCLTHDWVATIVRQQLRDGVTDLQVITEEILRDCLLSVQSRENVTVIVVLFKTFQPDHSDTDADSPGATRVEEIEAEGAVEDETKWLLAV